MSMSRGTRTCSRTGILVGVAVRLAGPKAEVVLVAMGVKPAGRVVEMEEVAWGVKLAGRAVEMEEAAGAVETVASAEGLAGALRSRHSRCPTRNYHSHFQGRRRCSCR